MIRQPIITVLGHVDHGKTSLLDYIRGSTVASREAGAITQHVGASSVPLDVIKKLCGNLLERFKISFTIPGLLFIDTPGHEVFTNLRKRGGSTADMAIVVVDITQGMQPQTKEAIEILKTFKVPFIIAANKVDLIVGWRSASKSCSENINKQMPSTKEQFEKKFYNLVGQLSQVGFDADLFTRVEDYRKRIAIVPISAKTGEGIPELLALIAGLSQKFLAKPKQNISSAGPREASASRGNLEIDPKSPAKGTILEIKEEKGIGMTADVVIYDGHLSVGDTIVIGGVDGAITSKIKALLRPKPLVEMRDARGKFDPVQDVFAASGVKIVAPELDRAVAGSPLVSVRKESEIKSAEKEIAEEIETIILTTDKTGIILKTDALGSLEAVASMLRKKNILIKKLGVGPISRGDLMSAAASVESNPLDAFVLGFNVKADESTLSESEKLKVKIITDNIIYHLIEKFEEEVSKKRFEMESKKLEGVVWPAKFKILKGFVFRASKPAIFGVEVLGGKLKAKTSLIGKDGKYAGDVKEIENEGKKIAELRFGDKSAVSVDGITVGRQVSEGDVLYVDMSEDNFRNLKERKATLSKDDVDTLKELANIKRKTKETWGL
ncbi:MAG: translation initiation factor IF-2 [Nanoarchaeota archaeon]